MRRAAGHDQRTGVLGRVFAITAAVCAVIFVVWFLVIHGPGSSNISGGSGAVRAAGARLGAIKPRRARRRC